jgi:hypothetical protein
MPSLLVLRGFGCVNVSAGLDSTTLDAGGVISKFGSSSLAKSKSAGSNGLVSCDASKIARARETS